MVTGSLSPALATRLASETHPGTFFWRLGAAAWLRLAAPSANTAAAENTLIGGNIGPFMIFPYVF
jgi:hypothetical protein